MTSSVEIIKIDATEIYKSIIEHGGTPGFTCYIANVGDLISVFLHHC